MEAAVPELKEEQPSLKEAIKASSYPRIMKRFSKCSESKVIGASYVSYSTCDRKLHQISLRNGQKCKI